MQTRNGRGLALGWVWCLGVLLLCGGSQAIVQTDTPTNTPTPTPTTALITIVDNLSGAGGTSDQVDNTNWEAAAFLTDNNAYYLTQVTIVGGDHDTADGPSQLYLSLYSDDENEVGSEVESLGSQTLNSSSRGPISFNAAGTTFLAPNTRYWLVVRTDSANRAFWCYADLGNAGLGTIQARRGQSTDGGANWSYGPYGSLYLSMQVSGPYGPLPSVTATPTDTPTATATFTATDTPTPTATATLTITPTTQPVIVDNLAGAGGNVDSFDNSRWLAGAFLTDNHSYYVTQVTVVAGRFGTTPVQMYLSLYSDNENAVGSEMESLGHQTLLSSDRDPITFNAAGTTILAPLTRYWLVVRTDSGDGAFWAFSDPGNAGPGTIQASYGTSTNGGANWSYSVFSGLFPSMQVIGPYGPIPTATDTPLATNTPTVTETPTDTATDTASPTPTVTDTPTPATPTVTPTASPTSSVTPPVTKGPEFQVNTYTDNDQFDPDVAMSATGEYVIVWTSYGQDGDGDGVYGQRYSLHGTPLAGEFQVNSATMYDQYYPSVAMAPGGDFVVAWGRDGYDDYDYGIDLRLFGADGTPKTGEVNIATSIMDYPNYPDVAMDSGGDFAVVWESSPRSAGYDRVRVQTFNALATPLISSATLVADASANLEAPALAMNAMGDFVVAWRRWEPGSYAESIWAQQFNLLATPLASPFQVNSSTRPVQDEAAVALAPDGNFTVTWSAGGYYSPYGERAYILARRFNPQATPLSEEQVVTASSSDVQQVPGVAIAGDGKTLLAWWEYDVSSERDVFGRWLDPTGVFMGAEFRINDVTEEEQRGAALAANQAGDFVAAWQSDGQDGDGWGVFSRLYGPTDTPTATVTPTATETPLATASPTATPTATIARKLVVDNSDAGFSTSGTWTTSAIARDKYGADYRAHATGAGSGDYAQWQVTLPQAGVWQVFVWYPEGANRTAGASYVVNYTGGSRTVVLNQQTNGGIWNCLGNYSIEPGDAQVRLSANSTLSGYAVADAVMWNYLGPQSTLLVDNTDPGFSAVGVWSTGTGAGKIGSNYRYAAAGDGSKTAQWQFNVNLCGFYAVDVYYSASVNRATDVVYTVGDGAQHLTSAPVNQRLNGSTWKEVQTLYVPNGSTVTVKTTNAVSSGYVIADAVRLRYFTPGFDKIVDNDDSGAAYVVGSWTMGTVATGKYGPNYRYHAVSSATDFVLYRPFLEVPGTYQVSIWYPAGTNRAPDAPYIIGSALKQNLVKVDQRHRGGQWVILGNYFMPAGKQGFVKIDDTASSGYVLADAIRMSYIGAPGEDWIVDNAAPGCSFSGTWGTSSITSMYAASGRYHIANWSGAWASWAAPASRHYLCSAYYGPGSNRAIDAPFRVTTSGPNIDVLVNQQLGYLTWRALNPAQLSNTVSGVTLYDHASSHSGYVIADAMRFTLVQPE